MRTLLFLILFIPGFLFGQNEKDSTSFKGFATVGFSGLYHSGIWGTTPAHPENDPLPLKYNGFAYGVNIDYQFSEYLSAHFDILTFSRKTPVTYNNGYAASDWIFEMTDYNSRIVGPFNDDYYYFVNSTGIRLGLKLFIPLKGRIKPWYGIYYGFYSWYAGIYNLKKTKTYGNVDGTVSDLSYLNLGINIPLSDIGSIDFFAEFGSPVTRNYEIQNCIIDGWTFKDYGEGFHLFGYNRFGLAFNFMTKRKK